MKIIQYNDASLTFLGRTVEDEENKTTFFNWTCSGFIFRTNSKKVEAELSAYIVQEGEEVLEPWLAVFIDEREVPERIIRLDEGCKWYTLFDNPEGEMHTIRVIKRTEAQYSKTGLKQIGLTNDGQLIKVISKYTCKIEFIGDSLTCGYGNESNGPETPFRSREENGWEAYAARTARKLKAYFHCVSVSGIGIYSSFTRQNKINDTEPMSRIYPEADYYLGKKFPVLINKKWDFKGFEPDYIVINLGTNDWSYISYELNSRLEAFKEAYVDFIKQVRTLNGINPIIICCAAPVECVQACTIEEVVEDYKALTGDKRIVSFAFDKLDPADGLGTASHPTVKSHIKSGEQLADFILSLKLK